MAIEDLTKAYGLVPTTSSTGILGLEAPSPAARLGSRISSNLIKMGGYDPMALPYSQREDAKTAGLKQLAERLYGISAKLSGDPAKMALYQEMQKAKQPKAGATTFERFGIFDALGNPIGSVSKQDLEKIEEINRDPTKFLGPLAAPPTKETNGQTSFERVSIYDVNTKQPIGSILKTNLEKIAEYEKDPNYIIGPFAGLSKTNPPGIEIKELVDQNNIWLENITEEEWLRRKQAGLLQPGAKLQNLGTGTRAADSPTQQLDKQFDPIKEKFIAGQKLITGLSDTAKIIYDNPSIANSLVSGGAKAYSFIESNVKGFDDLVNKGKQSKVYDAVFKSKKSYDSGKDWSQEIDDLVSATGITESRILDMAFALSASKGQEGKGLSDRDFQNAIDMLSKGFNAQQKIDLFKDIANRITTEFDIERDVYLRINPDLEDKFNRLGNFSPFVNPYVSPAVTSSGQITDPTDPLGIRRIGQ